MSFIKFTLTPLILERNKKLKKNDLAKMIVSLHPGSGGGQQQDLKAQLAVAISEDIEKVLIDQTHATNAVSESLTNLNEKIDELEKSFSESSKTSEKVAKSLNWLTGALVLIGVAQVIISVLGRIT